MNTVSYDMWRVRLRDRELPLAVVDLDAFDQNTALIAKHLGQSRLRPATKSLRVPGLMARIAQQLGPSLSGWMLYSAREAELLARDPESAHLDDLLIAYPVATLADAARLIRLAAGGKTIRAMVDSSAHLALFEDALAAADLVRAPETFSLIIDIDAAWRPLAGRLPHIRGPHIGVRRSPLRTGLEAVALAQKARARGLRLSGVMAYEAQVAGLQDTNPASPYLDPLRRLVRWASAPDVAHRRAGIVAALGRAGFKLEIVNGGGSGSLLTTPQDPSVTEVTAGSGFLGPHLFSGYRGLPFAAAALFALPVARFPDAQHITCAFGGLIASGPTARDRAPIVHLPKGLSPLPAEGFGEVQTPFRRTGHDDLALKLGDPILCRHAKAGELFEHFNTVTCFSVAAEPLTLQTYRGLGLAMG